MKKKEVKRSKSMAMRKHSTKETYDLQSKRECKCKCNSWKKDNGDKKEKFMKEAKAANRSTSKDTTYDSIVDLIATNLAKHEQASVLIMTRLREDHGLLKTTALTMWKGKKGVVRMVVRTCIEKRGRSGSGEL